MRKERIALKNCIDAPSVWRQGVKPPATHPYFAGSRLLESGNDAQERCFARSAFAEDSEKFPFGNIQGNAVKDRVFAEGFGDGADGEESRVLVSPGQGRPCLQLCSLGFVTHATVATAPPSLRSRFRCIGRGVAHSARSKFASDIRPRCRGGGISSALRS